MTPPAPEGETVEWLGVSYRTILSAEATGGAMSIVDSVAPAGSAPPRHVHAREDETFVLLAGACEFWLEGSTTTHGAGETIHIPRGAEHAFRVIGDEPCRMLVILSPAGFESFFPEMARGDFRIPDDMDEVTRIAARFHLTFTGPPLGAG